MLENKKILIIITGSVASYKALYLIRLLRKKNCEVNCIMTSSAKQFITPLSVSSLTGNKVYDELFSLTDEIEMGHISLAKIHDAIVVAPASANFISKVSNGLANDLASTTILATNSPVFYFPAMNVNMWNNPIIQRNVNTIETFGQFVIPGKKGELACGDNGYGRLIEPENIVEYLTGYFKRDTKIFKGTKALVTAGPTREPIDPVRYISNNSSGIQGYAMAEELVSLGAEVSLVSGPTNLKIPKNIKKVFNVNTAEEMYKACKNNIPRDLFISAAAVTDWKSETVSRRKIKKTNTQNNLKLSKNPDILKYVSFHSKRPKLVVGFAAETNSIYKNATVKLIQKNCDLLIANDVSNKSKVFGSNMNAVHIFDRKGFVATIRRMQKNSISKKILKGYVHPLLIT